MLGYTASFVARRSGLSLERLESIEAAGDLPAVWELERLARLYGVDADQLADEPILISHGDGIETLALLEEFRSLSAETRARIVAAANAARDLVTLRTYAGEPDVRRAFIDQAAVMTLPRRGSAPFQQGKHHADEVRRRFHLGTAPILSMRDFVATAYPAVAVLYADLGDDGVAGLSFVDAARGPAIVLNSRGKNSNPAVRRFSLAHELCHLLVDWNRAQPLAHLSGFLTEQALEVEQRANSFAVRLLCPEGVARAAGEGRSPTEAARHVGGVYGLHYSAVRLYLKKAARVDLPFRPPAGLVGGGTEPEWALAEEPVGLHDFPVPSVPTERRTYVARYAAGLYSDGTISRDELAEFLLVGAEVPVEDVLDFFALDEPAPGGAR